MELSESYIKLIRETKIKLFNDIDKEITKKSHKGEFEVTYDLQSAITYMPDLVPGPILDKIGLSIQCKFMEHGYKAKYVKASTSVIIRWVNESIYLSHSFYNYKIATLVAQTIEQKKLIDLEKNKRYKF